MTMADHLFAMAPQNGKLGAGNKSLHDVDRCASRCARTLCDNRCYMPDDHEDVCLCSSCDTEDSSSTTRTIWSLFSKVDKMSKNAARAQEEARSKASARQGVKRKANDTNSNCSMDDYPSPLATCGTQPG